MRIRNILFVIFLVIVIVASLLLWRLNDLDLDGRRHEDFSFTANGLHLAGTLWLPDRPALAALVLVHGDGPQDRTSQGGYAPLVNSLLDAGIAVASWDKPGIGASQGNWLAQSMEDRADVVRKALVILKGHFTHISVGAMGFSQAGWVIPKLSHREADFAVLIGGAVSWQQQGDYYTDTRLRLAGVPTEERKREVARLSRSDDGLFGKQQVNRVDLPPDLTPERWAFIRKKRHADATKDLRGFDVPLLALWGANDLNVDAAHDAAIYRETVLSNNAANRIIVVPNATHGLLKSAPYNAQLTRQWPWYVTLRFLLEGRHAWAPRVLDTICNWIAARGTGW
ncbi:hypothetical protein TH25_22830 [Thalassospira profundimaris]|uniref:Serine aminopeptidase S33 domain-containing protein n=2 Tax=Thalassospira profundimaris TaxID=502049 RepID=A0A367WPT2_9PROT|nr:hypothetical protein TH25_22830 [Thalassospira profundimaris]